MPINTFEDFALRIRDLSALFPELAELVVPIEYMLANHMDDWTGELSPTQHTAALAALTGMIVALHVNVACYPTGYVTAIFFDEDGNPIP